MFNKSNEIINCGIYLRVSTANQAKNGVGLEDQLKKCKAMAMIKQWKVLEIFSDDGVSGTVLPVKRPALKRLLDKVESGEITGIISYSLDRLGRTMKIITETLTYIDILGGKFICCREDIDTSSDYGLCVVGFIATLAEYDRKNINKRLRDGRETRRLIDGERGGKICYGYCRIGKKVAVDDYNSKIVKYIFECREYNMSLTKIANKLNDKGIPSPGGKKWKGWKIRNILVNKDRYLGGIRNNSESHWPKILPDKYKDIVFIKETVKIETPEDIARKELDEKNKKLENIDLRMFKEL